MNRIRSIVFLYLGLPLFLFPFIGCQKSDTTDIWNEISDIDRRLSRLEEKVDTINSNIISLKSIVLAIKKYDAVIKIVTLPDNEGYTIVFVSGKEITLYNGFNGTDGKDGHTPVISIKQDTNGIWYWTVDGEWLFVDGQKVRVTGEDGKDGVDGKDGQAGADGITPQLKIEDGYWYISYDNGKNWTQLGKATGEEDGKNGTDGKDGKESFIKGIEVHDGWLFLTLNDGNDTVVLLPMASTNEIANSSIIAFNPDSEVLPKLLNMTRRYDMTGSPLPERLFTMIHLSDIHGDEVNLKRVKDFQKHYEKYIDEILHTGDLQNYPTVPNNYKNLCGDFINVIGDHESWGKPLQLDIYNVYMKDFIPSWNVIQPEDATENGYCYFYKDYKTYNLRLIVLDSEHWNGNQKKWFEDILDNSLSSKYDVICAIHRPPFLATKDVGNPFDSKDLTSASVGLLNGAYIAECVRTFINNGGSFVCWLSGHIHDDVMGLGEEGSGFENQLLVCVATASHYPQATNRGSIAREEGNKSQDCFNIISVDTETKTLKIMRIGAEYDRYMRRKNVLSWDYGNNRLIYSD